MFVLKWVSFCRLLLYFSQCNAAHDYFYKRSIASRASSQTSFHLENIMNISRQWSQRAPAPGGPLQRGLHAMAQLAQWLIRHCRQAILTSKSACLYLINHTVNKIGKTIWRQYSTLTNATCQAKQFEMSLYLIHVTLIANQFSKMHSIFIGICRSINFINRPW